MTRLQGLHNLVTTLSFLYGYAFCLFVYLFICLFVCIFVLCVNLFRRDQGTSSWTEEAVGGREVPPTSVLLRPFPSHIIPAASLPVWAETSLSDMEDGQHSFPYNKLLNMVGTTFETEWVQCTSLVGCGF